MSKVHSIRSMRREGKGIAEIARTLEVSRNTVYKYLDQEDLSPKMPVATHRGSILDPYAPLIESWLSEDARTWRKQRHTAHRIWERLRDEHDLDVSESTVRHYVRKMKLAHAVEITERFLDLVWAPGEAQADFGEADFYVGGVRQRLSFFVLTFPFSNVGLAQVFPGQNAECVCQALRNIFEFIGGVPLRIVFDNAAGIGRKLGEGCSVSETFAAFSAHYGFAFSFCNPNAGHEKGAVENKVGFIRRNLFVPVRPFDNAGAYNRHLLDKCMLLSDREHWSKAESQLQLFMEDKVALSGLPSAAFDVVRYERHLADGYGKVTIAGRHRYSTDPAFAGQELICGLRADTVTVADAEGTVICVHPRAYGDAPTDTSDPASQLALLARKPGGWSNSRVREALSEGLREHMDSLGTEDLKADLRMMRDTAASNGWQATLKAVEHAFGVTGRLDSASVKVAAAGVASARIDYEDAPDLSAYDVAMRKGA